MVLHLYLTTLLCIIVLAYIIRVVISRKRDKQKHAIFSKNEKQSDETKTDCMDAEKKKLAEANNNEEILKSGSDQVVNGDRNEPGKDRKQSKPSLKATNSSSSDEIGLTNMFDATHQPCSNELKASGDSTHCLQKTGTGLEIAPFQLNEKDVFKVEVLQDGCPITGGPISITVGKTEGLCHTTKVKVIGATKDAVANKWNVVGINIGEAGLGPLEISVEGAHRSDLQMKSTSSKDFSLQYRPHEPGESSVTIKFGDNHVTGSPFLVNVSGDPYGHIPETDVNYVHPAQLKISDTFPSDLEDTLESDVFEIRDLPGHNYAVKFTPPEEIIHTISIQYKGIHIKESTSVETIITVLQECVTKSDMKEFLNFLVTKFGIDAVVDNMPKLRWHVLEKLMPGFDVENAMWVQFLGCWMNLFKEYSSDKDNYQKDVATDMASSMVLYCCLYSTAVRVTDILKRRFDKIKQSSQTHKEIAEKVSKLCYDGDTRRINYIVKRPFGTLKLWSDMAVLFSSFYNNEEEKEKKNACDPRGCYYIITKCNIFKLNAYPDLPKYADKAKEWANKLCHSNKVMWEYSEFFPDFEVLEDRLIRVIYQEYRMK